MASAMGAFGLLAAGRSALVWLTFLRLPPTMSYVRHFRRCHEQDGFRAHSRCAVRPGVCAPGGAGATQTQLVKAAFDYLLEERSLPQVSRKKRAVARRRLTKEQKQTLAAKLASCQLDIDIPTDVAYAKEAGAPNAGGQV